MTTLSQYTKYNYWANEILLSIILNELNNEKLDKTIISSFPSLRKTVYHLWDAEFLWIRRLKGESLDDWPSKKFSGTFSEAKALMLQTSQAFINYAAGLSENDLSKGFTYKNLEGKEFTNPIWESIMHCMNHSTYHRGQIVTMLRQLGITTIPSTDFITYCRVN
jgi:uncharacterized damage-inducible protein DinB